MSNGSGFAWVMLAWICIWPILAVVFGLLWYRATHKPRRILRLVRNPELDEDEND